MPDVSAAAEAVTRGDLVVYPTETVYGLGGDALREGAIDRVFELKGRPRDKPLSVAVHDVDAVDAIARPSDRARTFMEAFLPGPVTVVCEKRDVLPEPLTAGRDRVGIRIPDHELALELLAATGPITATSANVSGEGSVRDPADLDPRIRDGVAVILDDGETPGGGSTVVDVDEGIVHREGALADEVREWLAAR